MAAHTHARVTGATTITFASSLGIPVEGLNYRLSDGNGGIWTAVTGPGGQAATIEPIRTSAATAHGRGWQIANAARIQVEVQRDDGSWKNIGSFQYDPDSSKQVRVSAGAFAIPFQMDPV